MDASSKEDQGVDKEEGDKPPKSTPKVGEWKEMGIGPIRVLVPISSSYTSTVRLVQRRETTPGGQGTKVLLNTTVGQCDLMGEADEEAEATGTRENKTSGKVYKPEGKFCRVSVLHKEEGDEVRGGGEERRTAGRRAFQCQN